MTFLQLSKTQFSSNILHLHGLQVDFSEHHSVADGGEHHKIRGYFFFTTVVSSFGLSFTCKHILSQTEAFGIRLSRVKIFRKLCSTLRLCTGNCSVLFGLCLLFDAALSPKGAADKRQTEPKPCSVEPF